jgi:hypothetical protein
MREQPMMIPVEPEPAPEIIQKNEQFPNEESARENAQAKDARSSRAARHLELVRTEIAVAANDLKEIDEIKPTLGTLPIATAEKKADIASLEAELDNYTAKKESVATQPNQISDDPRYKAIYTELKRQHSIRFFGTPDFQSIPNEKFMELANNPKALNSSDTLEERALKEFHKKFPEKAEQKKLPSEGETPLSETGVDDYASGNIFHQEILQEIDERDDAKKTEGTTPLDTERSTPVKTEIIPDETILNDINNEINDLKKANQEASYMSDAFKQKYGINFKGNDAAAYVWIQNRLMELQKNKRKLALEKKSVGTVNESQEKASVESSAETENADRENEEAPSIQSEISPKLIEAMKREKEFGARMLKEAREQRNKILEGQGKFQLSREDFNQYFAAGDFAHHEGMKQQNVGDCYAVAAIHAFSRSPHFEMIIRSSLKRLPNGSWEVKVPLLNATYAETITISPEEISSQKNPGFLKRHGGIKDDLLPDFRRNLDPMKASEGFQVLEAAFIKAKFGKVNRLSAEGGWGDDVLLKLGGEENFGRYRLNSAAYDESKKKWEFPGLESLKGEEALFLDHILDVYDPDVFIVTVSTKHLDTSKLSNKILNALDLSIYQESFAGKVFVAGHAYSLTGVDKINKTVTLANPWNTKKPIKLTIKEFKKVFSAINAVRIDNAELLKSMNAVHSKE